MGHQLADTLILLQAPVILIQPHPMAPIIPQAILILHPLVAMVRQHMVRQHMVRLLIVILLLPMVHRPMVLLHTVRQSTEHLLMERQPMVRQNMVRHMQLRLLAYLHRRISLRVFGIILQLFLDPDPL